MSNDIQVIHRCLERERLARKKAESLLEMREAELLDRHQELTTVVSIMRGQLEMLEDAVNSMLVAIVTLEVDGTIRLFNRNAQKLFGLAADEILGTSFRSLMPQIFSRDNPRRLRDDLLLGQVVSMSRVNGRHRDGTTIAVDLKCSMTVRKYRRRLTLLLTPSVVDEESATNEVSQVKQPERREAARTEVGPPLAPSGDFLKFLASYEQLRSQRNETTSAEDLIQRVDSMVGALVNSTFESGIPDELLSHSLPVPQVPESNEKTAEKPVEKTEQRKKRVVSTHSQFSQRAVRKRADVNELLKTAIDEAQDHWSTLAELTSEFDPEVPPIPGTQKEALVRVLHDLLTYCFAGIEEAINQEEKKYERGSIQVSTRFDDEKIQVRISDNGVGLMSIVHDRVPELSGDQEEINIQQGLADCQAIINDTYHGEFSVRTTPTEGTTFEVTIPVR